MYFSKVHTNFKAVYNNFTNWEALDFCIRYNRDTFRNLQVIKSMFEGVTCGILNTSNMIHKDLFVEETNDICPSATELHNVSTSGDGMYIRYCGNSLIYNHGNIHKIYFLLIQKLNKKMKGKSIQLDYVGRFYRHRFNYNNDKIVDRTNTNENFGKPDHTY